MEAEVIAGLLERHPDLRMTYEEFLHSGDGVHGDWVDGTVRLIGPDSAEHNGVVGSLVMMLRAYAAECGGRVLSRFQRRPRAELPSREVDVFYVSDRARLRDYYLDGPADLAIEVVMEESRELDAGTKVLEYAQGGVREYWVIDPERKDAVAYRLAESGRYEGVDLGTPAVLRSEAMPGMWVAVDWLWEEQRLRHTWVLKEWGLI